MEATITIAKTETETIPTIKSELEELKDKYLEHLLINNFSECTIKNANYAIIGLSRFLKSKRISRIADVTTEILQEYQVSLKERIQEKNGKPLAKATIIGKLQPIKEYFRWLAKNSIILYDPTTDMEIPIQKKELPKTILTIEEVEKVLSIPKEDNIIGFRDKTIMELLYATGIRNMELRQLTVRNVNLDNKTIFIKEGKGSKDRVIPLIPIAQKYLKTYMETIRPKLQKDKREQTLFLNLNGKPFDRQGLCELIQKYAQASNVNKPVTAHIFRHSIATHLLENGMSIRYIQEFLGHASLGTTQRYARVTIKDLRRMYAKHHPKQKRNKPRSFFPPAQRH